MAVISAPPTGTVAGSSRSTVAKSSDPTVVQIMNIAIMNPTSPIRLTRNAFLPASALALSSNQNPMSK